MRQAFVRFRTARNSATARAVVPAIITQSQDGIPMPMAEHSILVGKSYRTPHNEWREVSGMEKGDVVYLPVDHGPRPGVDVGAGPIGCRWRNSPPNRNRRSALRRPDRSVRRPRALSFKWRSSSSTATASSS